MKPVVADVAVDITLECWDRRGNSHLIDTVLGYHRPDAYAVTMTFMTGDEPLTWTFARDLLIDGLCRPTGDGDVHIAPATTDGRAVVLITLSSPDGHLLLEAPSDQVVAFVDGTLDLVPAGTESSELDLDDLIGQLFS